MNRLLKILFIFLIPLSTVFLSFYVKNIYAANTGTVNATVTAKVYSLVVNNTGGIAFGAVDIGSSQDTTSVGVGDSSSVINNGNVSEKINIQTADSTSVGIGWTMATSPGIDTFTMKSCTSNCNTSPAWMTTGVNPAYVQLFATIAAGATQPFDLQILTPTNTSSSDQQSIVVTLQAVAP